MGRQWNPDAISDSTQLPAGVYVGRIKEIEETQTKEFGKLMYVCQLEVIEPAEFHGMLQRDNFVIGSDTDVDAEDPKTWEASLGAKRLKALFKKARVPFHKDLDVMRLKAQGHEVGWTLVHKQDPKNPQYVNANVTAYKEVGTAAPVSIASATTAKVANTAPAGVIAAVAPKAAPKKLSGTIQCPTCDEMVAKTEFAAHADMHEEQATAEG